MSSTVQSHPLILSRSDEQVMPAESGQASMEVPKANSKGEILGARVFV